MPTKPKIMPPIHPGETLREDFLKPLGLTANRLSAELFVPVTRVNDIVRDWRAITADTALRLARYFGTTPRFWTNLQSNYALELAQDHSPLPSGARVNGTCLSASNWMSPARAKPKKNRWNRKS
jgi:antitoxin HigA-1